MLYVPHRSRRPQVKNSVGSVCLMLLQTSVSTAKDSNAERDFLGIFQVRMATVLAHQFRATSPISFISVKTLTLIFVGHAH